MTRPTPSVHRRGGGRTLVAAVALAASVAVLAGTMPAIAAPGDRSRSTIDPPVTTRVWDSGTPGITNHRIPGIAITTVGTVIVATEARFDGLDDGPHDIALKRSLDGGTTWGADIFVEQSVDGQSWANPTPVVDQESGRIFLFYALNHHNVSSDVYYSYSDDDGLTWSSRVDVTGLFAGNPNGWTMHLPGPGHGIQLDDGRLVVEVWSRKSVSFPAAQRAYGATVIYSDDGGATWQAGGGPAVQSTYPIGEAGVEVRSDGDLLLLGRYSLSGTHSRIGSVSDDGGETWADPYIVTGIPVATTVQAGYARMPDSNGVSRLIFSRPVGATTRTDLTVAVSYDDGATFPVERLLKAGAAQYSDIAVREDGTILVVYEVSPRILVAQFSLDWLTTGSDSLATGPDRARTVIEAESLTSTASDPTTTVSDANAGGGQYLELDGSADGDYVDVTFTVATAGTYDIGIRYARRSDRARFQASVDGTPLGSAVNGYAQGRAYPGVTLGTQTLAAGTHHLRLTVVGASAGATDRRIGLDYLMLTQ